jgi:hypothetical protein
MCSPIIEALWCMLVDVLSCIADVEDDVLAAAWVALGVLLELLAEPQPATANTTPASGTIR